MWYARNCLKNLEDPDHKIVHFNVFQGTKADITQEVRESAGIIPGNFDNYVVPVCTAAQCLVLNAHSLK